MIFFTHVAFALFVTIILQKYFPQIGIIFLTICLIFSAFPDIDIGTSMIGRHFRLLNFFMKHRGITHTIVFMTFCVALVFTITKNQSYAWAILLGYSSHLFLDCLTPSGLNLFWPAKVNIRGPIRAGGVIDMILFAGFVTGCVLILS